MSLWEELKRRKVVKVAIAYAVVAWVLVQVADIFFPALRLPAWTVTLVAGLVILGFPIALVLAWAYELTPGGLKLDSEVERSDRVDRVAGQRFNYVILSLIVVAVTILAVDRLVPNTARTHRSTSADAGARPVIAATITLDPAAPIAFGVAASGIDSPMIALSPDGRWLVYVGASESGSRLYRRRLDGFAAAEAIPGTEGAIEAFFSPDGQSIGFETDSQLKRVPLEGNGVHTIANVRGPRRGYWTADDWVYLADDGGGSLHRVRASGGDVEAIIEQSRLVVSDVVPDGRYALAIQHESVNDDYASIQLVDLRTGAQHATGVSGYDPRWVPTGHVLFGRSGNVFAVPFDLEHGRPVGEPVAVRASVAMDSSLDEMQLAISPSGTVAYVPGTDRGVGRIVRVNAAGEIHALPAEAQHYAVLDLGPHDRMLALHVADVQDYVWVYDLARDVGRKIAGSDGCGWPVFARSGELALSKLNPSRPGSSILSAPPDGAAQLLHREPELLLRATDWSPEGDTMVLEEVFRNRIGLMSTRGEGEIQWRDQTWNEWGGVISPDGRWLAYASDESGRFEVWVASLNESHVRHQVTSNGGMEPVWCPCGRLFFRRGNQFWSVAVQSDNDLSLSIGPEELFSTVTDFLDSPGRSYDVSSDGQTLFMLQRAEPAVTDRVHILANWFDELERVAPRE